MSKKKPGKNASMGMGDADGLRKALTRRTKAELVEAVLQLARSDRKVLRRMFEEFELPTASGDLAAATRQAIAEATDFDRRQINRNFDYDSEAYRIVQRNFERLIASGQLQLVMTLALELMAKGSQQVEMSDEGLMTDDIEECLNVVIQAVKGSDLPAPEIAAWASAALKADGVNVIATEPLESLRRQFQVPTQLPARRGSLGTMTP